jgi:DNA-binding transcriptional regulator YbjK
VAPTAREQAIAEAATAILGSEGPRGLTHRAVDRAAGLPVGSTSNLYRTRAALLAAINRHVANTDAAGLAGFADALGPELSRAGLAEAAARVVEDWSTASAVRSAARLELYLEARRSPEFARDLGRTRETFRVASQELLASIGCEHPEVHAVALMALIDGLVENQLLHRASALGAGELREVMERWVEAC